MFAYEGTKITPYFRGGSVSPMITDIISRGIPQKTKASNPVIAAHLLFWEVYHK